MNQFDPTACYLERLSALDTLYAEVVIGVESLTDKYDKLLFGYIGPALDRIRLDEGNSEIEYVARSLIHVAQNLQCRGVSFKSLIAIEDIFRFQVDGFWARFRFAFKHRKSIWTWVKTGEYY